MIRPLFLASDDGRVFLLLLEPGEFARKLLALLPVGFQVDQEASRNGIGDPAVELAEIAEIRDDPFADLADDRDADQHPER